MEHPFRFHAEASFEKLQTTRGHIVSGQFNVRRGSVANLDHTQDFLKAVTANEAVAIAYIVTDEERLFESIAQALPDHVQPVRLYEAYLRNFEIESGRGSL